MWCISTLFMLIDIKFCKIYYVSKYRVDLFIYLNNNFIRLILDIVLLFFFEIIIN